MTSNEVKQFLMCPVWIVILVLFSSFCYSKEPINKKNEGNKANLLTVNTAIVSVKSFPLKLESIGTLRAEKDTQLSFAGAGHLVTIQYPAGANIKKGDIVAVLDSSAANAALAAANAKLIEAQSLYERYQLVKNKNVYSQQDYVSVRTKLDEALADKKAALIDQVNLKLKAPYSGVLGDYNFDLGAYINVGTPLIRLVDISHLDVTYSLEAEYRNQVKTQQRIVLTSSAVPNHSFIGKVIYIAPTVDPTTGRFDVKARVDNNDHLLSPGFSSKIQQFLGSTHSVLIVPQTAVTAVGSNYFVFRIDANHYVERIAVQIGDNTNDGNTKILQGLQQGDIIATSATERLESGMKVRVQNTSVFNETSTSYEMPMIFKIPFKKYSIFDDPNKQFRCLFDKPVVMPPYLINPIK